MTDEYRKELKETLTLVYNALKNKGYDPILQITGYLMSGDETYITPHDDARKAIRKVERDDLIIELLTTYFN